MKRNMRTAFNALQKMGAPVFDNGDNPGGFKMSAEDNSEEIWADFYYGMHGYPYINERVEQVMADNGVFFEWDNAGCLSAYEA